MEKPLAVVLVSGGMDSLVALALANQTHRLALLHFNYGQISEGKELKAFNRIAEFYRAEYKLLVDLDYLKKIGGTSLIDQSLEIPSGLSNQIPTTYVPFRNAQLVSVGVSWGEVVGAEVVFIGAVEEDSAGYPDCRREFYTTFNRLIELGTRPTTHIEIKVPLIGMKKGEIAKLGIGLKAPFELSWSCYRGGPKACGRCDSCLRRLRAFQEAGYPDPLEYDVSSPRITTA